MHCSTCKDNKAYAIWLILQLFGGPLGILERRDDYEEDENEDDDILTLYICKKKLSYGSVMILCMLIVGFGILALSSASNLALIQVTIFAVKILIYIATHMYS